MMHLQAVRYRGGRSETYPFNLAVFRDFEELNFEAPLTFFVGENGSGKSTLLEGLAALVKLPAVGSQAVTQDPSLEHARSLAKALKPIWLKAPQRGFFLRAEDFFGFVKGMNQMRRDLKDELRQTEARARERGASEMAVNLAKMPYAGSIAALEGRYGEDLDAASHGESFLQLLQARVVPRGLYLLDEPEAALSPMRQLALLAFLKTCVEEQECQFVIATHSPILLAFPAAQIVQFSAAGLQNTAYNELEHVSFTRDFLRDPERYLRHL